MERTIITTEDGSKTIFLPELNEHYHSSHGALQEAQHVFIRHGLHTQTADYLTIVEMGFGTGLNALLTYFASEKRNQFVNYIGVEAFPPSKEEIEQLNYGVLANDPEAPNVFDALHAAPVNQAFGISEHFALEKRTVDFRELELESESVDLIYYDAFGPRVAPELWTVDCFQKAFNWLSPGGMLVTYCAKGQVKRDLKQAGFVVTALPGPPGKREMTRAIKPRK